MLLNYQINEKIENYETFIKIFHSKINNNCIELKKGDFESFQYELINSLNFFPKIIQKRIGFDMIKKFSYIEYFILYNRS